MWIEVRYSRVWNYEESNSNHFIECFNLQSCQNLSDNSKKQEWIFNVRAVFQRLIFKLRAQSSLAHLAFQPNDEKLSDTTNISTFSKRFLKNLDRIIKFKIRNKILPKQFSEKCFHKPAVKSTIGTYALRVHWRFKLATQLIHICVHLPVWKRSHNTNFNFQIIQNNFW